MKINQENTKDNSGIIYIIQNDNKKIEKLNNDSKKNSKKIKNCSLNHIIIYLFSCFFKNKRNTNIQFLEKANNFFAEKMDIFNIFKIIKKYNTKKIKKEIIITDE